MLKLSALGPRSVSTFSDDSKNLALAQTYCCWSVVLPLKPVSSVQIRTPVHHKHFFENSRLYSLFHSRKYLNRPGTLVRQAQKICSDATHVLHSQYQLLPPGKRYIISKCVCYLMLLLACFSYNCNLPNTLFVVVYAYVLR